MTIPARRMRSVLTLVAMCERQLACSREMVEIAFCIGCYEYVGNLETHGDTYSTQFLYGNFRVGLVP